MSSGSINDIAIKLGIDATGVATGMKHATAEALRASREIDKAESVEREHNLAQQVAAIDEANKTRIKLERDAADELAAIRMADADRRLSDRVTATAMINKLVAQEVADERSAMDALAAARSADADRRVKERAEVSAMISKLAIEESALEKLSLDSLAADRSADADRRTKERAETTAMISKYAAQEAADERKAMDIVAADRAADADRRTKERQETAEMISRLAAQEAAAERSQADAIAAERMADADRRTRERKELADMVARYAAQEAANELAALKQIQLAEEQAAEAKLKAAAKVDNDNNVDASRFIDMGTSAYDKHVATLVRLNHHRDAGRISIAQYDAALKVLNADLLRNEAAERAAGNATKQHADSARVMTGVMTQASFAAEDFIQGIVFGDIRTALLGASNNLTMVARGLIQVGTASGGTAAALAGVAGWLIAIPAAAVAMLAAFNWAHYAEMDVRSLSKALEDANIALGRFRMTAALMRDELRVASQMRGITDTNSIDEMRLKILDEQKIKERELQDARRKAAIDSNEFLNNQLGGSEAVLELQKRIDKTKEVGSASEVAAARELERLMSNIREAARQGKPETAINDLRQMYEILNNMELDDAFDWTGDITALDKLEEIFSPGYIFSGEDQDRLNEIRKTLNETGNDLTRIQKEQMLLEKQLLELAQARAHLTEVAAMKARATAAFGQQEVNQNAQEVLDSIHMTELDKRRLAMQQQMAEIHTGMVGSVASDIFSPTSFASGGMMSMAGMILPMMAMAALQDEFNRKLAEELRLEEQLRSMAYDKENLRKSELLFYAQATASQKYLYELQKQENKLLQESAEQMAMAAASPMGGMGFGGAAGAMQMMADQALNMELLAAEEARLEKQLAEATKLTAPIAQGGLEQNSLTAQGKAFEEVYKNAAKQDNPQLRDIREELKGIRAALANNGVLTVVQGG